MSLNILEYPSYTKSLEYLEIACWYWLLEYSRMLMKFQAQSFALLSAWNFMDVLEYSSFYKKNPTNHADSRTFKNIQGIHKTLDILGSS